MRCRINGSCYLKLFLHIISLITCFVFGLRHGRINVLSIYYISYNNMKIIIHWVIAAVAILITAYILPGVAIDGFVAALVVAVILGIINAFIRPLLVVLTLPITILTLGLFVLVINGLLVMLAAAIVPGFAVASFWSAFVFGIVLALVSAVLHSFEKEV